MIEELVQDASTRTGLSLDQARLGLSAALALMQKHGEPEKVGALFDAIPGTRGLAAQGAVLTEQKSGGLMGGLMRNVGGSSGAAWNKNSWLLPF